MLYVVFPYLLLLLLLFKTLGLSLGRERATYGAVFGGLTKMTGLCLGGFVFSTIFVDYPNNDIGDQGVMHYDVVALSDEGKVLDRSHWLPVWCLGRDCRRIPAKSVVTTRIDSVTPHQTVRTIYYEVTVSVCNPAVFTQRIGRHPVAAQQTAQNLIRKHLRSFNNTDTAGLINFYPQFDVRQGRVLTVLLQKYMEDVDKWEVHYGLCEPTIERWNVR